MSGRMILRRPRGATARTKGTRRIWEAPCEDTSNTMPDADETETASGERSGIDDKIRRLSSSHR